MNKKLLFLVMALFAFLLVTNPVYAASPFTEDFSGLALPSNMEDTQLGAGSVVDYSGANAAWDAADTARGYIRTIESDYHGVDFVAEATVDILDGIDPSGIGFFGLGTAVAEGVGVPPWGVPTNPAVFYEVAPDGFAGGFIAFNDNQVRISVDGETLVDRYNGWDGIHRVRLTWTAATKTALMEIDKDYAGGAFVADFAATADGSDNGFDATNSHIFFGGGGGVIWDDISVTGIRGYAHTPVPTGTAVVSTTMTEVSWYSPLQDASGTVVGDPNIVSVDGYDVYLYGRLTADVIADDPNFVGLTPTSGTAQSLSLTPDPESTYFWRVDTTVTWDSNDLTGTASLTSIVEGPAWQFSTLPLVPVITGEPVDTVVVAGNDAYFSVVASNADTYAWYNDADALLVEGTEYSGVSTDTLTVIDVQAGDEDGFYCVVSNAAGPVPSATAQLALPMIITADLQLHLEADSGVIYDGANKVSQWQDQSGHGNHVEPNDISNAPTYVTDGMRGKLESLDFDGVDDCLLGGPSTLNITNDHTVFVIADAYSKIQAAFFSIQSAEETSGIVCYQGGLGNLKYIVKATGGWTTDYISDTPVGWQEDAGFQATFTRSGTTLALRYNGVQKATDTGSDGPITFPAGTSKVMIGIQGNPTAYENCHEGSISAILVYNRALSDLEMMQVETYLKDKWIVLFCGQEDQVYPNGDINRDCAVDIDDIAVAANGWLGDNTVPGAGTAPSAALGHWPFEDNLTDVVAGNDAQSTDPNYYVDGIVGRAYDIDLGNEATLSTASYTGSSWSLSWWEYALPGGNDWQAMLASGAGDGWEVFEFCRRADGRYSFGIDNWAQGFTTEVVAQEQWHHHVVAYDSSTKVATWYLDGEATVEMAPVQFADGFDSLLYVGDARVGTEEFKGYIDELRLYSYPLDNFEVAILYTDAAGGTICPEFPEADLNEDCKVNLHDFAAVAATWLDCTDASGDNCP